LNLFPYLHVQVTLPVPNPLKYNNKLEVTGSGIQLNTAYTRKREAIRYFLLKKNE